jgi:hypothetical protein
MRWKNFGKTTPSEKNKNDGKKRRICLLLLHHYVFFLKWKYLFYIYFPLPSPRLSISSALREMMKKKSLYNFCEEAVIIFIFHILILDLIKKTKTY